MRYEINTRILLALSLVMILTGCNPSDTAHSDTIQSDSTPTQSDTAQAASKNANGQGSVHSFDTHQEQAFLSSIEYSNLVDSVTQAQVKQALIDAGIDPKKLNDFFESVALFNQSVDTESMVKSGFVTSNQIIPKYDESMLASKWRAKHPNFAGYNCRITSFDLFNEFIRIERPQIQNTANLFVDKDALENMPKQVFSDQEMNEFLSFFSQIPTVESKDISKHIDIVKNDWQKKGISFIHNGDKSKASLISVFIHAFFDKQDNNLFIGHIGVLVPFGNDLLFVEKLAFEAPYQVTKLKNRTQLNDLLMSRYDIEWGQPNAKPFIFENDALLEGYRPNPHNMDQGNQATN